MLVFQLGLLLCLLLICSLAPGSYCVRKLPWSPLEKLSGGVGLSLVLLYLASWGVYCLSPRGAGGTTVQTGAFVAVSLICVLLGILARKDLAGLIRSFRVRRAVLGYAFLLLWTVVNLAMIRNYSGLDWGGDWSEHFQRSLFFLHRFPAHTPILGGYELPARPPMMNVLAAFFLAQAQDRFELFQVASAFLNTSVLVGVGVVGERDFMGSAHLTLMPMEVLGLSLIAAAFPWRRLAAIAIVAGCFVDFSLGVFLQARLEAFENTPQRTVFTTGLNLGRAPGRRSRR
jgi:hypothetical protein